MKDLNLPHEILRFAQNDKTLIIRELAAICGVRNASEETALAGLRGLFRNRLVKLKPLPFWVWMISTGAAGVVMGLGLFTFAYGEGLSYMKSDPEACANCHVMQGTLDGWNHSSHKAVAACNDCHLPHSLVGKYLVKALNGWHHSYAFTTSKFPQNIRIKKLNRDVVHENCLRCHGEFTSQMSHAASSEPTDCLRCHQNVGHVH